MIDNFTGLPFGLTISKDLLDHHQVLTHGRRLKREGFVDILVKAYLSRGGSEDMIPSDPVRSMRKVFPEGGEENERFKKLARACTSTSGPVTGAVHPMR